MVRKRAARSDSIQGQRQAVLDSLDVVPPPAGVRLRHDTDVNLWNQLARTRVAEDWREYDLICLGRIVRFENDMRELDEQIDATGNMIRTPKGWPAKNPLLEIRESLMRQQMVLARAIGITALSEDLRSVNARGRTAGAAQARVARFGKQALLARPS